MSTDNQIANIERLHQDLGHVLAVNAERGELIDRLHGVAREATARAEDLQASFDTVTELARQQQRRADSLASVNASLLSERDELAADHRRVHNELVRMSGKWVDAVGPRGAFRVYDSLVSRSDDPAYGKPHPGMHDVVVTGDFGSPADGSEWRRYDEAKCRAWARRAAARSAPLLVDVEHFHGDEWCRETTRGVQIMLDEVPRLFVGVYGTCDLPHTSQRATATQAADYASTVDLLAAALMPDHNYYATRRETCRTSLDAHAGRWQTPDARALLDAVRFTCPVLYAKSQDDGWVGTDVEPFKANRPDTSRAFRVHAGRVAAFLHAVMLVGLSRRLAPDKPCIPILWPRNWPGQGQLAGPPMSGPAFRSQLETARALADSAILWDSPQDFAGKPGVDESAPWYQQAIGFAATLAK